MYKKINYITAVLVLLASISVNAQITTQSPYSRFGIGNIKGTQLPQFRAMGGISAAVNKPSTAFNNNMINVENPASFAGITATTIDIGMTGSFTTLKNANGTNSSFNGALSHVALAFPVTAHSAFSFGIMPYSEIGYNYIERGTISSADPNNPASTDVNYLYSGEGGLTKAYIGYGFQIADHFRLGGNVEYLFGNLIENRSSEFALDPTTGAPTSLNTRLQNKNSIGGISFSYGAQYDIQLDSKTSINFGYSGSSPSSINSTNTFLATKYLNDANGDEVAVVQTVDSIAGAQRKLKLPLVHTFGIVLQKNDRWLIGADFRMGNWSKLSINSVNQGLQDTKGVSVGGQITPDFAAINSYFKRVDYRLGFSYDKTYVKLNDQDIKDMAITFGLGLPLARPNYGLAFYKMNFTTELGRRGTTNNGLLQETYINFHLGFTLNDKWFRKFKFD